jgi:hypothetical protein
LNFAFADNPQGGKGTIPLDGSAGKDYLLQIAEHKKAKGSITPVTDTSRLLKQAAQPSNLAAALLDTDLKSRMCDPPVRFRGSWRRVTSPGYPTLRVKTSGRNVEEEQRRRSRRLRWGP